jgi:hypothetical protein
MATALPPSSTDSAGVEVHYRKPRADLYTLMLAIALVAVLIGIIFLVFENQLDYEWKMKESIVTSTIVHGTSLGSWLAGFFC